MGNETQPSDKNKKNVEAQVWIALIGAISAILIAVIKSQAIISWVLKPTSTPITTLPVPLADTAIPIVFTALSNTPELGTATPIVIIEPSVTAMIATETPSLPIGMHVRLYANKTSGKVPLTVKLDARDSFLRAPGGEIFACKSGACEYTWEVYSGGQRIGKAVHNSTGTFQYTFAKRGSYFITVWVCRGGGSSDCNGSGTQIIVN